MFIILLTSLASADIIMRAQPKELYSLGEIVHVPLKIATLYGVEDFLSVKLICSGIETEIHKQYLSIPAGGEQDVNAAIPLTSTFIGRNYGTCKIKTLLGVDYVLSNEFKISNTIIIEFEPGTTEVYPEESIIITGTAIKENNQNVQGFISLTIGGENGISTSDTVKNGYFLLNISLPKETEAGQHLVRINVYEKDGTGNISNQGFVDYNIKVLQVPTNLEIVFEDDAIPGEDLKIKAVLHDQTGEKIESNVILTLKNDNGKILEQIDINTDEYLEYPIEYNHPPVKWNIIAESNDLITEEAFNITKKEYSEIDIVNKTIIITNKGNVPYNETVVIKIGNTTLDFDAYLEVDEIKKYSLTAPDGEYEVEIRTGDDKTTRSVMLTGGAINIKEVNEGLFGFVRFPFVWIFIIGILGFMLFMIFKKGYRKAFIGYITKKRKPKKVDEVLPLKASTSSIIIPKNPAVLSLSIKGDKQNISLVCIKIKNEKDLEKNDMVKEVLQKITNLAEEHKAVTYQNQNNMMFMWVPIKTKTFKNQKKAIEIAQEAKEILDKYNKLAKKKIDYGMSINYGTIIAKSEKDGLKFMSMGSLITEARKIALLSEGDIYLTQAMHEQTLSDIKSQKHDKKGHTVYTVKEMKRKSAETKKFIHNFIEKLEKENKQRKEAIDKKHKKAEDKKSGK